MYQLSEDEAYRFYHPDAATPPSDPGRSAEEGDPVGCPPTPCSGRKEARSSQDERCENSDEEEDRRRPVKGQVVSGRKEARSHEGQVVSGRRDARSRADERDEFSDEEEDRRAPVNGQVVSGRREARSREGQVVSGRREARSRQEE